MALFILFHKEQERDFQYMLPENRINDTHPRIRKILIEGYRRMSPIQKMKCVSNMTNTVLCMALMRIRKQHSGISEQEERLRLASLWLEQHLMIRAFNWDPEKEGY